MPMNTPMAAIQELGDNNGRAAADSRALSAPFPEALNFSSAWRRHQEQSPSSLTVSSAVSGSLAPASKCYRRRHRRGGQRHAGDAELPLPLHRLLGVVAHQHVDDQPGCPPPEEYLTLPQVVPGGVEPALEPVVVVATRAMASAAAASLMPC